jgi:hypothetical protein
MKYIIKLNDKIISKRNTIRVYNYCWVRVVQRTETTYFYKNTGETISFKDKYPFTKEIVLNGQMVNQDEISYWEFKDYIDETKTITKLLNDNYVFNECSLNPNTSWVEWKQSRLLFSEMGKFSEEVNGVRTVEFKHYVSTEKKVA